MITTLSLKNFTVFEHLDLECASGINVFIGENGTGKTHLLKVIYAASEISTTSLDAQTGTFDLVFRETFKTASTELIRNFSDHSEINLEKQIGDRVSPVTVSLYRKDEFTIADGALDAWCQNPAPATYIPAKEILSNAPGFRSLYSKREVAFEKVYYDIIDQAFLPPLKNGSAPASILEKLEEVLGGTIEQEGERFYLKVQESRFDFMLVAEGLKKLGLLWLLIKNGSIADGSVLCWDEPDANLNPKLLKRVVSILLELQKMGVQIFLSTHNYILLKEFDLQAGKNSPTRFHAFYRDPESGAVKEESTDDYLSIAPNAIADTFDDLYDRDIKRTLRGDSND